MDGKFAPQMCNLQFTLYLTSDHKTSMALTEIWREIRLSWCFEYAL